MKNKKRCDWSISDGLMIQYHDTEWGKPIHDDKKIFEFLILECFQAGLSWSTILKKRENFRKAFSNFNPTTIAKYTAKDKKRLMNNAGIIRNRLKIDSAVTNAQNFLKVKKEFGTFDQYIWHFVNGKPIKNKFTKMSQLPASTPLSDTISQDLKERGFKFVGTTIIYAHMQATGLVNDHVKSCFRY